MTTLYILHIPDIPGMYKVGITSKSVQKRVIELQIGSPYTLCIFAQYTLPIGKGRKIERVIHDYLGKYHTRGEWFCISDIHTLLPGIQQLIAFYV
jgi:hypothetical protein